MTSTPHTDFRQSLLAEPAGLLEQILAGEIAGAAERLRRCNEAEARLGDFDPAGDNIRRSIEKSRAADQLALHRIAASLEKFRAERRNREEKAAGITPEETQSKTGSSLQMASNCKSENAAPQPAPAEPSVARSAPCPCGSGEKFKRCRGRNSAPVLVGHPRSHAQAA